MANIGLLEGFAPSRMRVRPPVVVGNTYDLVPTFSTSLRRRQPNYLRGDTPGSLSTEASIGTGVSRGLESIYNNAMRAALAIGKTQAEAKAAANAAVAARQAAMVESANARIATAKAAAEVRRIQEIAARKSTPTPSVNRQVYQTLIDDYQDQHPQGSRGGSGSVVSDYTFKIEPDKQEEKMMPIDTRGGSTAA